MDQIEKAKQLFKTLETKNPDSRIDRTLRAICIQDLMTNLKKIPN